MRKLNVTVDGIAEDKVWGYTLGRTMAYNTGDLGEIGGHNGNEKDTREWVSLMKAWLGGKDLQVNSNVEGTVA